MKVGRETGRATAPEVPKKRGASRDPSANSGTRSELIQKEAHERSLLVDTVIGVAMSSYYINAPPYGSNCYRGSAGSVADHRPGSFCVTAHCGAGAVLGGLQVGCILVVTVACILERIILTLQLLSNCFTSVCLFVFLHIMYVDYYSTRDFMSRTCECRTKTSNSTGGE